MKMLNLEISNEDACFIYGFLNDVIFSSRRNRNNPSYVKVSAHDLWRHDSLMKIYRIFDGILNNV